MDNNFENNQGAQPQRPFTERPGEQPQPQPFEFSPEKPLMQKPEKPAQTPDQGFDPIRQTATYQDGAFNQVPQPPQNAQPFQGSPNGYGALPQYNAPRAENSQPAYYSNAYYQNRNQGYPQNYGQPVPPQQVRQPVPQQPQTPQTPYVTPLQSNAAPPEDFSGNPYAQQQPMPQHSGYYTVPKKEKPKSNKGLIAVIIVLAVLLAASFTGMMIFVFNNAGGQQDIIEQNDNGNSNGFRLPDEFDKIIEQQPATEAPEFKESDYSDKTQKDYKGLAIAEKPADAETNKTYGAEYAFDKASPAVVCIKGFADKEKTVKKSEGSGIIISEDGYVITNAHVILNSKTAMVISVYTADGKEYNAGVVGFDSRTDIALLKMDDAKGLTAATFGNSDKLERGEDILIVGNPGGMEFQNSMTKGIVSALERDASNKSLVKYIQTDAAINPGNSGGPAVNMYGQVVGIATAKIVDEKYEGMGFCIPSATAKNVVDSLMKNGYVENRVKIGIAGVALTSDEAAQYGISGGIYADEVDPDGPCGKAGLKEGDVIYEADGEKIGSFSDIYNVLENHKEGDKIKIKYYRYDESGNKFSENEAELELAADKG